MAVHPGSGSLKKNWPVENFVQVCRQLIERHQVHIALIRGPADGFVEDVMAPCLPIEAVKLIHQPNVMNLAAWLQQCRLYLGNDSGISHIAAAIGIPTVALFGPSNLHVWRPIGPYVTIIQGNGGPYCEGISVDEVWQTLNKMFDPQQSKREGGKAA